jgi:hypothetical protein
MNRIQSMIKFQGVTSSRRCTSNRLKIARIEWILWGADIILYTNIALRERLKYF